MTMADIKVPDFGESIIEGTIGQWMKQEGDFVESGEVVVEIETDKVNAEVPADQSGVLKKILKKPGENVRVGEVIALLEEGGTAGQVMQQSAPVQEESAESAGGNERSQAAEEQSQKAESQPQKAESQSQKEELQPHTDEVPINRKDAIQAVQTVLQASPAARKLAREQQIDLHSLNGSDPLGRLRKQDVITVREPHDAAPDANAGDSAASRQTAPQPSGQIKAQAASPSPASESLPVGAAGSAGADKPAERIRLSRRRQTIARNLVQAQQSAAMLTTFNEVDMTAIMALRNRRKDTFFEKHHVKLGFMSFFVKGVIGALKAYPLLNAEIDGNDIILKKYYDIGVAVSTEEGLVVPVVHHADRLNFAELERKIAELAEKARSQKLTLDHLRGGTFTVTNGGVFGSLLSTPILNAPQVGILGMHKIQTRPVAIDEERMENRPMMYTALTYDHRIVDGREAVGFLVKLKQLLEDPESLLLEG